MDLTEPDAGSDLQRVMLKATQDEDGTWRLNGVKRFITNGAVSYTHLSIGRFYAYFIQSIGQKESQPL